MTKDSTKPSDSETVATDCSKASRCFTASSIVKMAENAESKLGILRYKIKELTGSKLSFRWMKPNGKIYKVIGTIANIKTFDQSSPGSGLMVKLEQWQIDGLQIPPSVLMAGGNHLLVRWGVVAKSTIHECFETFDCNAGDHSDACPASVSVGMEPEDVSP